MDRRTHTRSRHFISWLNKTQPHSFHGWLTTWTQEICDISSANAEPLRFGLGVEERFIYVSRKIIFWSLTWKQLAMPPPPPRPPASLPTSSIHQERTAWYVDSLGSNLQSAIAPWRTGEFWWMPRYFPSERRVATSREEEGKKCSFSFSRVGVKTIKPSNSCLAVDMTAKWFLTERHLGLRPIWLEQGRGAKCGPAS